MLEAIGAPIREIELVPWVTVIEAGANSRDDVVTLASLVASRCAEMRLTIPQVQTENPRSGVTLNFGAVLLRITNTGGQGVSEGPPMMGTMGLMAAYTGQEVTWEQAMNSQQKAVCPTSLTGR